VSARSDFAGRGKAGGATRGIAAALALVGALVVALMWFRDRPPERPVLVGRPNVVMISIDTLRADHLSAYGYTRETSPHIDALAARGVLFENAYAHSPKTAVSHMSILTGLTPGAHGVKQWTPLSSLRLSVDTPTLSSLLHDAGYYTAAITSGGHMRADLGFDDGMDFFQVVPDLRRAFRRAREVLTDREGGGDRLAPFFLFVHTYEVHAPYTPIAPYDTLFTAEDYDGAIISSQAELVRAAAGDWGRQYEIFWQGVEADNAADLQHLKDLYDGSIRFTDEEVGSFLDWLAQAAVLDQTLVIVLSDHGEEFQDHGRFSHDQSFEELLHVPLVMSFPGARSAAWKGLREAALVRLVDVAPTVLDFLAVPVPDHLEGVSLLPLLSGGAAPPEIILSDWPAEGIRTLRDGDWKLMERVSPEEEWAQLYDLEVDPKERNDVAGQQPDILERMRQELRAMEAASRSYREARVRGRPVAADEEALRQFQALGYTE
jgi:arylsulfatase A-like enzyme